MLARRIGIDIGTATTRVVTRAEGIVLEEPTVVAMTDGDRRLPEAVGREAVRLQVRHPAGVRLSWPLAGARVVEAQALDLLLQHYVTRVSGHQRLFRPDVMVSIPSGLRSGDRRRVLAAVTAAGARTVHLIDAPLAAGIGAGLPTQSSRGSLVVHLGAGVSDVAVLSRDGTIAHEACPICGRDLDRQVAERVLALHRVRIADEVAEQLKCEVALAPGTRGASALAVSGSEPGSERARTVTVRSEDLAPVGEALVERLAQVVERVLRGTPPGLRAAVRERGVTMTGGAARLRGLGPALGARLQLAVTVPSAPDRCVALGTGRALERLEVPGRQLLYIR